MAYSGTAPGRTLSGLLVVPEFFDEAEEQVEGSLLPRVLLDGVRPTEGYAQPKLA